MLKTLAVQNYRTLRDLVVPLGPLNISTGPNGSGKSNIYKALRLLAETAPGGVIGSLAREGELTPHCGLAPGPYHERCGVVTRLSRARRGRSRQPLLGFEGSEFSVTRRAASAALTRPSCWASAP